MLGEFTKNTVVAATLGVVLMGGELIILSNVARAATVQRYGSVSPWEHGTTHYNTYMNSRFGFTVRYPSSWNLGPRPNNDDGRWFTAPSGVSSFDNGFGTGVRKSDVLLQVVGTANAIMGISQGYNFNQMVAAFKKQLHQESKQPGLISEKYTIVPNKWIIDTLVLKVGHNGVSYTKIFTSLHTNQSVSLTYPASQANLYAPIWNHIASSFVPGNRE